MARIPDTITSWLAANRGRADESGAVFGIDKIKRGFLRIGPCDPELASLSEAWLGPSLWWQASREPVPRPWHAIVSSRVGRHPETHDGWMRLLELAMRDALRDGATMLVPQGNPASAWIEHAAKLFHVPFVRIQVADGQRTVDAWLDRLANDDGIDVHVSPCLNVETDSTPRLDRFAIGVCDRVNALYVRAGGNLEDLTLRRIAEGIVRASSIRVAVAPTESCSAALELVAAGAIGWYLPPRSLSIESAGPRNCELDANGPWSADTSEKILSLAQLLESRGESLEPDTWPYLVHCTRAPEGPWPGESARAWRDRLMLASNRITEPVREALLRILQQQTLLGGHRTTRGQIPVVCFSGLSLPALLKRRTFRAHLGRWDYEPYGIAIRKSVIAENGGKPVIYGDSASLKQLPITEHPWFQHRGTKYDWTSEQEWRVIDRVPLQEIAANDAFVFVPDQHTAAWLSQTLAIRWPIVVSQTSDSEHPTPLQRT